MEEDRSAENRALLESACQALPLFPLPGMVFLPFTLLPLHVFEPRYRALISDALAGDGVIAVPNLLGGEAPNGGVPPVASVVGVGRIVQHQELPDGRSNVVLAGIGRATVLSEIPADAPYRIAHAAPLAVERPVGAQHIARLQSALSMLAQQQPAAAKPIRMLLDRETEAGPLSWAVGHMVLRDSQSRQCFLEETFEARVERLVVAVASMGVSEGPEA